MRFTRLRIAATAGLVTAAAAVAATTGAVTALAVAPASASQAAVSSAAAKAKPVVLVNQCSGKGQVKPSPTIPLPECMPSSVFIGKASWTSWGSVAFGAGVLEVNNCTPSCAGGKYIKYPILIVLWRAEPWAGKKGEHYFSRMTWIYTGKRPSRVPVTHTVNWPAAAE
jgi:hypothetical protein